MSYILDALKKAEAERHLGSIPHLHAQPAAALPLDAAPLHTKKTMLLAAGVLLLVACAALAWFQPWQSAGSETPAAARPIQQLPAPLSAVASTTAPDLLPAAGNAAAAPEIVAITPPPAPVKPAAATKPKKAQVVAKPAAPVIAQPAKAPPSPTGASDGDLKLSTALTQNNPLSAVITQRELPEQIQRELPAFAIGGYIYSENQRERQLLVNRRLVHEGEEAAPGVILETMLPKAAVFNYRGYRYRVAY